MPEDRELLLARIDERVQSLKETMDKMNARLETHFVSQSEFQPIKRIVYGCVGMILTSVLGAIVAIAVVSP
jgi:hypothetical protein